MTTTDTTSTTPTSNTQQNYLTMRDMTDTLRLISGESVFEKSHATSQFSGVT